MVVRSSAACRKMFEIWGALMKSDRTSVSTRLVARAQSGDFSVTGSMPNSFVLHLSANLCIPIDPFEYAGQPWRSFVEYVGKKFAAFLAWYYTALSGWGHTARRLSERSL